MMVIAASTKEESNPVPMEATEGFLGEIRIFAGNFAPRGWAFCDGQMLAISSYSAVFSLLGTVYGGDGRTTFALPDLRGRTALHSGDSPDFPNYNQGQKGNLRIVQGAGKVGFLGLRYIICLQGTFPSRS